jgi:two-component system OmpR family sensor kinase
MAAGLVGISALTFAVLRKSIDDQLNATLLNVASIQAASVTDAPSGEMRFHEWELTPDEAARIRELNRFAQVWTVQGQSLLRTRYITRDLPLDREALERAAQGELAWAEQRFDGMNVRSLYYPLSRSGPAHGPHVLQVAAPLESRDRLLRRVAVLLGVLTLLVSGANFLGSWWLAARAVRPVREITQQAKAIEAGTLDRRISAYADSEEYDGLVRVLNTMLARLYASFETQRRFAADASHELRSPLTALRGEIELARRRRREPEEYERVLDSALEEVERLSRITEDLLMLARSDAQVLEPALADVKLDQLARDVVERLRRAARAKEVHLEVTAPAPVTARADRDLMQRLLWNLLANAIKFTPAGGNVDVRLAREDGRAIIEVRDDGPGIPEQDLDRVFDRFYQISQARTPGIDSGTGLGLSIVQAIAELHGGAVTAANRPGGGAVFRLTLPAKP